jgi:hypothetical protein
MGKIECGMNALKVCGQSPPSNNNLCFSTNFCNIVRSQVLLEDAGYVSFQQALIQYELLASFVRSSSRSWQYFFQCSSTARNSSRSQHFLRRLYGTSAMLRTFLRPVGSTSFFSNDANTAPSDCSAEWWRTFAIRARIYHQMDGNRFFSESSDRIQH